MIGLGSSVGGGRVLDFDIENRPLSYWVPERPTAEVTAIAMCWVGQPESMEVVLLGRETLPDMLLRFVAWYSQADLVTGHYIRRHDLPILNGALLEQGMAPLAPKMTSDTKMDLVKRGDIPATQEYLLELLGLENEKYHMTQGRWREANRLTPKGLIETERRVLGDVTDHMAMRAELLSRGLLGPPKMWRAT